MKCVYVGDPHVRPNNLEEWENLAHFILETILSEKPDRIVILGDLLHTHSVIRLEVLDFWNNWLDILSEACELYVLVGNHDQSGDFNQHTNALSVFKRIKRKTLRIIENPQDHDLYAYMPYYHNHADFIESANYLAAKGCKVLVCHQTFSESQFENGMYAPDGIDPDLLNYDLIISGHIHKSQQFGKIVYPGTATWQSASDANEDKGIWLYDHDDQTGKILSKRLIRTAHVVTKIVSLIWKEGEALPAIPSGCKVNIELVGSSQWVSDQKKALKGSCSVKTRITDKTNRVNRTTGRSFEDFISTVYPTSNKERLIKYMRDNGFFR